MWEISLQINSPKNNDPSLWEPVHAEPTQTEALELLGEEARAGKSRPRDPATIDADFYWARPVARRGFGKHYRGQMPLDCSFTN
jgi:hypothetical protein